MKVYVITKSNLKHLEPIYVAVKSSLKEAEDFIKADKSIKILDVSIIYSYSLEGGLIPKGIKFNCVGAFDLVDKNYLKTHQGSFTDFHYMYIREEELD